MLKRFFKRSYKRLRIKESQGETLRQTINFFSIWEDRGGLCHFNRGTVGGPLKNNRIEWVDSGTVIYVKSFFENSYKRLKIRNAQMFLQTFL